MAYGESSFRGASSNTDGSAAQGAVTLGKRFSRNFYAAYERSLSGALGTLYLFSICRSASRSGPKPASKARWT